MNPTDPTLLRWDAPLRAICAPSAGLEELKLDSFHAGFDAKKSSTFQAQRAKRR